MTPDQFLEMARVFPEALLLVTGSGLILAGNPAFLTMLDLHSIILHNRELTALVDTPPEQVLDYLASCSRSRAFVLGTLIFHTPAGLIVPVRSEGGVIQPWSEQSPALIMLRLQRQDVASNHFLELNNKIDELSREIHERRHAQEEVYHQREHLRVTLSSIGDAVIVTDAYDCIHFMNSVAEALTGWRQADATGLPLETVFTVVDKYSHTYFESPLFNMLHTGRKSGMEAHKILIARDGTERAIEDTSAPMRDADGELIGMVVVFRDITERRRAEARQHLLAEASTILASSLAFEVTVERIAHIAVPLFADMCLVDMLQADSSIQRVATAHADPYLQELLSPASLDTSESGIDALSLHVIYTGQSEIIVDLPAALRAMLMQTHTYLHRLLALGVKSTICVPLRQRGHVIGSLTFAAMNPRSEYTQSDLRFAEDLAYRCTIALDNAQLYREAREAIHLRDNFLSVASHELKTPLTSLFGNAQLLQRRAAHDATFSPAYKRTVEVIVEQARRLNRMIMTLLDISRIETGQLTIEPKLVDVGALVQRVITEITPTLDKHRIEINLLDGPLLIDGDELRLEQIFQNLITNAVKYSPFGGSVSVQVMHRGNRANVLVSDKGIGIPQKDLAHLFERFYRASNVDTHYMSGLGIGLFVVKEIVTLHGGEITVTSTEGVGSTFTVSLPLHMRNTPALNPNEHLANYE